MANQYTKKKQREQAELKEKERREAEDNKRQQREKQRQDELNEESRRPMGMAWKAISMDEIFKQHFPMMSKCDEKAMRGMPHFTLLATDNFAPQLIQHWIELAYQFGTPEAKIFEAKQLLKRIQEWRTANPLACKTPD